MSYHYVLSWSDGIVASCRSPAHAAQALCPDMWLPFVYFLTNVPSYWYDSWYMPILDNLHYNLFNTVLVIAFFFLFNSFVEFKSSLSAMTALRELHNTKWGESHITIQWERSTPASPREKQSTKVLVAGLGTKHISHSALHTYIKRVLDATVRQDLGNRMTLCSIHVLMVIPPPPHPCILLHV